MAEKNLSGQCSCGAVTYEIVGEPLFVQACHCTDCQTTTGSAFVVHVVIPEAQLQIQGDTSMSTVPSGSGMGCELHYCSSCAVFIWVRYLYHQVPVIAIRAGTLNDKQAVTPQAHIFTQSKQAWVQIPSDVPSFEQAADRDAIWPRTSIERYEALPKRDA
jgi:hypothetical protein